MFDLPAETSDCLRDISDVIEIAPARLGDLHSAVCFALRRRKCIGCEVARQFFDFRFSRGNLLINEYLFAFSALIHSRDASGRSHSQGANAISPSSAVCLFEAQRRVE